MRKISLLLALTVLSSQPLLSSSLALAQAVTTPSTSQASQSENSKVKSTASPTIKVNPLTIYVGQAFTATDMVVSAVDGDGLPIDYSKLTITGVDKVDTSKYGTYKIGFSYEGSEPVYGTLTVSEAAQMIPISSSENWGEGVKLDTEKLLSIVSTYRTPDYNQVTISGQTSSGTALDPDSPAVGTYNVKATYQDTSTTFELVVTPPKVTPMSSSQTWYFGTPLDAEKLVSITSDYESPDYSQVTISGQTSSGTILDPDSPAVGTYNVTAAYKSGTTNFELEVKQNQSELALSFSELSVDLSDPTQLVNLTKNPYSLVTTYKDQDGNSQTPSKDNMTVTGIDELNSGWPSVGDYTITYSGQNGKTATLTIHVTGDKIKLVAQDVDLVIGDTFDKNSGLKSATDSQGNPGDMSTLNISESDNVDTSKSGNYTATYSYFGITATANVTVKPNSNDGIYIDKSELTRYQNDDFDASDLIDYVMYSGEKIDKSQVAATYDTSKINTVGTFDVTYTYKELTKVVTVTVNEDKSSLSFKDGSDSEEVSSYSGQYNEPFNTLVATRPDGTKVTGWGVHSYAKFSASCTEGNVKSAITQVNYYKNQVGTIVYTITYRGHTIKATHHVLPIQTSIKTKDTTLVVDSDTWKVDDNFVSATTYDGKDAKYDSVSGSVPTDASGVVNKVGVYQVTYLKHGVHSNDYHEDVSATATIRVVKDQSQINLKAMTIYSGDSWKASDQFVSGLTKLGVTLTKDDVATDVANTSGKLISYTITDSEGKQLDTIDNTTSGKYTITYQYGSVIKSTTLTVVTYTPTINVHNSSVFVGSDWTAANNFDLAYTAAGKRLAISDLTVDASAVDLNTPGEYQVKYSYGETTATAKLTVKERHLGINVHDSSIVIGSSWSVSDNFDSASDSDGNAVPFDQLTTSITDEAGKAVNTIDTSKAGTYTVTYDYTDSTNTSTQSTAKVTIYSAADLQVTNVRIPINTEWDPSLAFIAATSPSGDSQTWDQIKENVTITGTVDPSVAKSYSLTYAYEGITKDVKVTVVGERILTVPKSTDFGSVTLGPTSSALNLTYPGGDIKVEDSVENSKGWTLTAKVSDSTSDFNQYLMNGDKTLTQNSQLGSATSGGTTTVSEGWQGTKKGLWIDYSTAQKVRTDDVKIKYTLTPSNSEVAE